MLKTKRNIFFYLNIIIVFFIGYSFSTKADRDIANSCFQEETDIKNLITIVKGVSSYYAHNFHNKRTASGEVFDMYGFTAAHRELPFGTIVKVVNKKNNQAVLLKINDRGPFIENRIIDISYQAAKEISGLSVGIPQIDLIYFNTKKIIKRFDSTYYLGYSSTNPFIVIKKTDVTVLEKSDSFENMMDSYYSYSKDTNSRCYIFVEVGKVKKNAEYVLGFITPKAIAQLTM